MVVDATTPPVRAAANPNAELLVEPEEKRSKIPLRAWNRGARIIARVVGDSMDGGDGEFAYLKPARSKRTANGHVTLIRRDDERTARNIEIYGFVVGRQGSTGLTSIG